MDSLLHIYNECMQGENIENYVSGRLYTVLYIWVYRVQYSVGIPQSYILGCSDIKTNPWMAAKSNTCLKKEVFVF
jgi:hypothetical protein